MRLDQRFDEEVAIFLRCCLGVRLLSLLANISLRRPALVFLDYAIIVSYSFAMIFDPPRREQQLKME